MLYAIAMGQITTVIISTIVDIWTYWEVQDRRTDGHTDRLEAMRRDMMHC